MNDIKESFGARVKEIRNCAGLSQEQLAQLSNLRKENISKLENGNFNVTLNTIDKLSVAFKLPHKEFFDFSSPMIEKKILLPCINLIHL
jgi:Predicted transcriptional regulators